MVGREDRPGHYYVIHGMTVIEGLQAARKKDPTSEQVLLAMEEGLDTCEMFHAKSPRDVLAYFVMVPGMLPAGCPAKGLA